MTADRRPQIGGWPLPRPATVTWIVVVSSVVSYFVYGRAVANLVAIVGAIILTIVIVVRDRAG